MDYQLKKRFKSGKTVLTIGKLGFHKSVLIK